jgi:hypothetical protein
LRLVVEAVLVGLVAMEAVVVEQVGFVLERDYLLPLVILTQLR